MTVVSLVTMSLTGCRPEAGRAELPAINLQLESSLGGDTTDLVPIGWLQASRTGRVAFGQAQDGIVRFLDSEGRLSGQFGRPGDGPGEFREVSIGGWTGDSLWAFDGALRRFTIASPEGVLARSFPAPPVHTPDGAPASGFYSPLGLVRGDSLIAITGPSRQLPLGTLDPRLSTVLLLTREGRVAGIIGQPAEDRGRVEIVAEGFSPGSVMRTPFYAVPLWSVSAEAGRVVFAETVFTSEASGEYTIVSLRTNGDTAFVRTFPFESVAIPAAALDSAFARLFPPTFAGAASLRDQLRPPASYPPLTRLIAGSDGSTWIGLRAEAESHPWVVLDSLGNPVGRVFLSAAEQLRDATLQHAWVTIRDTDGIESIVHYRVTSR